jgi:glycosyltransferase involved in cell wall biosynthesis
MKIGIFTEYYLPSIGGQEIRYAELAASLLQVGHSVDVYCIRHSGDIPEHEVSSGVSIFRYPLAKNYKQPLFKPLKRAVIPLIRYSLWVRGMARPENYDLLLFNQWPLLHIVFAKKKARARTVLDWCEVRSGWLDRLFLKYLPKLSGRNTAVSHAVADSVALMSGRRVECVPSGVWLSNYRCETKEQRSGLIYLGRITEHKNLGLLIEAYELMKDAGYSGDLTIAGAGSSLGALTVAAKSSRFSSDIHFLGLVNDQIKIDLLAKSEVLVISSRREGFPRVVAEAMASGLPVATVDFPENGTKTVVQDYGIGVVSHPTAMALSLAVEEVLRNWNAYSECCLKCSLELDWSLLAGKLLKRFNAI